MQPLRAGQQPPPPAAGPSGPQPAGSTGGGGGPALPAGNAAPANNQAPIYYHGPGVPAIPVQHVGANVKQAPPHVVQPPPYPHQAAQGLHAYCWRTTKEKGLTILIAFAVAALVLFGILFSILNEPDGDGDPSDTDNYAYHNKYYDNYYGPHSYHSFLVHDIVDLD